MYNTDSMDFVQERLRHNTASVITRELRLRPAPRVKRRFALRMAQGEARTFERVDDSVYVRCTKGSLWITHDGDPKDVILSPQEGYRAQREDAMHVFALQPCVLEIEFDDDVTEH
ncbi:DUF2917 domain-containing protein [Ramlibacter pallidus]|uniref:DUF2917 domain-containing protein n=1 Tax=Ramlibacter pallidus TaxID=2780087 RepID=A0ABR9S750_9BURK|nr:DUF2917 domain-containing protein [Ramlibacter pallidus]MBE7369271.1 DUF2917 domain-containing protein [Ramlibacter pallidus]